LRRKGKKGEREGEKGERGCYILVAHRLAFSGGKEEKKGKREKGRNFSILRSDTPASLSLIGCPYQEGKRKGGGGNSKFSGNPRAPDHDSDAGRLCKEKRRGEGGRKKERKNNLLGGKERYPPQRIN